MVHTGAVKKATFLWENTDNVSSVINYSFSADDVMMMSLLLCRCVWTGQVCLLWEAFRGKQVYQEQPVIV